MLKFLHTYIIIPTGEGTSGDLAKVQFAQIVEGSIVYDDGKSDHHVFGGKHQQTEAWLKICLHHVCTV